MIGQLPQETLILVGISLMLAIALIVTLIVTRWRGPSQDETLARQMREDALEQQMSALINAQGELGGRLAQLSEAQSGAQIRMSKFLEDRLDKVSNRMNQSISDTATKTAESLGKLNTRLTVIDEAQKNITDLSGQVIGLQDILSNKQARGAFGEIQMSDLVRDALPPSSYSFQATLSNSKRVDCLIDLPNPPGSIAIDSKFPLEAYQALAAAEDDHAKKIAARSFRTALQKHIKDISSKYIIPGETADCALMFLPSEAVYAELHGHFPDIVQESFRAKVWIASPTTLMALLHTVRAVLKDVEMREQAGVIQTEVGKMMEDVGRLGTRVGNLKRHFGQAEKDLLDITTSTEKILRHGEKIENVHLDDETSVDDALSQGHEPVARLVSGDT